MSTRPRPRAPEYPDYSEPLEGDEMTTWLPSEEPMDPGEVTTWITSGAELPDFERTEARGPRSPLKDPAEFEATGKVRTPRQKRQKRREPDRRPAAKPALKSRAPAKPKPAPKMAPPKRRAKSTKRALPTPEPAPRRKARLPTPEPAPRRAKRKPERRDVGPPTPEPAPPRRAHSAPAIDEDPSITIPRPPLPEAASAPRSARSARAIPPAPPVPQPPPPVPDTWTPAPSDEFRDFQASGDSATEIQPEYDDFPNTPDVPNTVVSEDSVDEVPPGQMREDAPTVMRPDMPVQDIFAERSAMGPPQVLGGAAPPRFEEMPQGEPTVALPPPSQRNRSHMDPRHRDPTPEPVQDRLPTSASYTPPPAPAEPTAPSNRAPRDVKSEVRAPRNKSVGRPPPPSQPRRRTNEVVGRSPRLPKNVEVVSETGGVQGHHIVYGVVGGFGVFLIALALFAGLVVLAMSG